MTATTRCARGHEKPAVGRCQECRALGQRDRNRELAEARRKPCAADVMRARPASPDPLPVRCTPCHVCGSNNEATEPVERCRLCGTYLKRARFTFDGWGAQDLRVEST